MNRSEFLEKYKDVEFRFVEYWKHKFEYQAKVDDDLIEVWLGDKEGDIYRNSFTSVEKISDGELLYWRINGGEIEE